MSGNALRKKSERRKYRRVSDAIALQMDIVDEAANEGRFDIEDLPDYPTHVVSLSPSGLKCFHTEPFSDGDVLQLSMKFFPSQLQIDTTATVINSGEEGDKHKNDRYFAGLSFNDLDDENREVLLNHIKEIAQNSFGGAVKLVN